MTEARRRIVDAAQALLDGKLDALRAAEEIIRWRWDVDPDQEDADLLAFVGIESLVDELLVADSLKGWPPDVQKVKKAEYADAERFFRPGAIESARALISRYGRPA
jgi:hypothetical protein